MKISKQSWHYKLLNFFNWTPWSSHATLCEYGWKVFGALLVIFVAAPFVISGMFLDLYAVFLAFTVDIPEGQGPGGYLFETHFGMPAEQYPIINVIGIMAMVFGGMAWIVLFVIGVVIGLMQLDTLIKDRRRASGYYDNIKIKEPGLFASWWRAHKEKYCPIIEYED